MITILRLLLLSHYWWRWRSSVVRLQPAEVTGMTKEMIISSSAHETRVAILEEDQVAEIFIERERQRGVVGNLYKGRVSKVLPGMQSAFVDLGLERDGLSLRLRRNRVDRRIRPPRDRRGRAGSTPAATERRLLRGRRSSSRRPASSDNPKSPRRTFRRLSVVPRG